MLTIQQSFLLCVKLDDVSQAGEARRFSLPSNGLHSPFRVSTDLQIGVHILADASVEGIRKEQHHHIPQRENEDIVSQLHRWVYSILLLDAVHECKRIVKSCCLLIGSLHPVCPKSAPRTQCS